jgi:SagB-type dehydrogenase family enzyme
MTNRALDTVLQYHDQTKHHPGRYARSLGYLDWNTQPDPFRRYDGAPVVELPLGAPDETPPYERLFTPDAVPPVPLSAASLSRFFEMSLAVSAWKQAGLSRWALRCNPSSGNLHPTEGYAALPAVEGIGDASAVYHYAPKEHALERRCALAADAWNSVQEAGAPLFLVGLSSIHWREAWKYGERAFRYCNHDVGHALGALRMAAAALGWRLRLLDGLGDRDVSRLLGLDRVEDFGTAEPEHPDLLAAVWPSSAPSPPPASLPPRFVQAVAEGRWTGRANALSRGHVDWPIIDTVAEATVKPTTDATHSDFGTGPMLPPGKSTDSGLTALQIARQRRSAVDFDGKTPLPVATFYRMLGRLVPDPAGPAPPWDARPGRPRVHLFLFVHRVEGLAPGLYALARDRARVEPLKSATNPDFAWQHPPHCPETLPLFRLLETDCRQAAAYLSLGQDIAGDSAFSLGMVAEFEPALRAEGAWLYRRLFWEAGLVGQVLYLEAEAAGLRGTGIGAYFDDLVHDALGLTGRTFQSLYHFTVGGPVEDPRITTLPPYPPERLSL